jgi:hypothetical protein
MSYYKHNLVETYKLHTYFCIGIIVFASVFTLFLLNINLSNYKESTKKTFIYNNGSSILISDINNKTFNLKKNARANKTK